VLNKCASIFQRDSRSTQLSPIARSSRRNKTTEFAIRACEMLTLLISAAASIDRTLSRQLFRSRPRYLISRLMRHRARSCRNARKWKANEGFRRSEEPSDWQTSLSTRPRREKFSINQCARTRVRLSSPLLSSPLLSSPLLSSPLLSSPPSPPHRSIVRDVGGVCRPLVAIALKKKRLKLIIFYRRQR